MPGGPAVVDYDPRWPSVFEALRVPLDDALSDLILRIEHVGSTSVPGLAAKPIIDMDIVVEDPARVAAVIDRLRELGYEHEGDFGLPGREAFRQPPDLPTHHLYLVVDGNRPHRDHVDFRNYLRQNPEAVRRYAQRKRELAPVLALDRTAYTEAKGGLVQELLQMARAVEAV